MPDPRPAVAVRSSSADRALDLLARHADDPSAVLALDDDTCGFVAPGIDGFVAYRRRGRWLLQIGGAYAAEADRLPLWRAFMDYAEQHHCRVLAVQLQERDARDAWRLGFTVNQLGASYTLEIASFGLSGRHFMQLRNKISRARRADVSVEHIRFGDLSNSDRAELDALDAEWLAGKHAKPLRFMVGRLGGRGEPLRRMVIGRLDGRVVGYLSLSRVFGTRPGWLHDLSRRAAGAPPGVMELLVADSFDRLGSDAGQWWHFGFTPFSGLDPVREFPGASRTVARLTRLLAEHGQRIYPSASQVDYKRKWGDLEVLPDYLAFSGRPSLGGITALIRTANLL
ncbi:MAG: DUF2156 domain-containing protein [Microlunatus sp.]|nr:DUF2156 domain-containing protein [Microlunatus sp.]MDN5803302.1 DUF2156 domain-containing protein [Microlunatus sp.]